MLDNPKIRIPHRILSAINKQHKELSTTQAVIKTLIESLPKQEQYHYDNNRDHRKDQASENKASTG